MFEDPLAKDMRGDVAKRLGVSTRSLEQLHVGYGFDREGTFSSWPERDAAGKVVGIMRRYRDNSKKIMRWSRHGLYFAIDADCVPDVVLCPEGGSDVAALLTIGLHAIGRPSNASGVDMLGAAIFNMQIKPRRVIVLAERDAKFDKRGTMPQCPKNCHGCSWCWPGAYGARTTAARLREMLKGCDVLTRLPAGKDVRTWLNARRRVGDMASKFLEQMEVLGD